jgi:hypothetical protein
VTDDDPIDAPNLSTALPKAEVFVLRVWREAGDDAAPLRLRIVPAANDAAPRYFSSWQALAEWGDHADDEPGRQPRSSQGET